MTTSAAQKQTIDLAYLRSIKALVRLQGREYLTHNGLLRVGHEHGLESIHTELVSWDAQSKGAVIKAVVVGERGTFTGHGDASPANVAKHLKEATLRMAETRAVNRALRLYTGLGMCTTEELPGGGGGAGEPGDGRSPLRSPTVVEAEGPGCAACGRRVPKKLSEKSTERHGVILCAEHMDIWAGSDHESFDEAAATAFSAELERLAIDRTALELRCVASPQWGKRTSQMAAEERERLMGVIRQHNARKRGDDQAAARERAALRKGEGDEEKAARQAGHSDAWKSASRRFFARLKEVTGGAVSYDQAAEYCTRRGFEAPSVWPSGHDLFLDEVARGLHEELWKPTPQAAGHAAYQQSLRAARAAGVL